MSCHPRLGLGLAACLCLSPLLLTPARSAAPKAKTQEIRGKVVPLAEVLAKEDVRLDPDASPYWLALVAEDGKVYPLVKDQGSRRFFKDKTLLDRPMLVSGRVLPLTGLLQVLQVRSVVKGQVHDLYYWCEVCAIRRNEKMICECCGGPMELREEPLGK